MGQDDELFPEPELELLHTREYEVRSYKVDAATILLRGAVRDRKPPRLYIPSDDQPLTIHHMVVDLVIEMATMTITSAEVVLETHPHTQCPRIEDHYQNLVGLSIARGFTHRVRELFGGPRGCTHTTALLQAMGPVAIQSRWSMAVSSDGEQPVQLAGAGANVGWRQRFGANLNTCHVWAEDGELAGSLEAGGELEAPLWIVERYDALGLDLAQWVHNRPR